MPSQCRSIISANFSYGASRCHFAWFATSIPAGACSGSFSAWGAEVKDTGLLVVLRVALCGPVWSLLGMLVFELVALERRITVVTNAKAPVAIGGHEPGLAGGGWNAPITGDKAPYRGRS